jgi:hypothetical protein
MRKLKKSNFHLKSAQGNLPNLIFRGSLIIHQPDNVNQKQGPGAGSEKILELKKTLIGRELCPLEADEGIL